MRSRIALLVLALALTMGLLLPVIPAQASRKGRKTTALALTGAAVYHLVKGHGPETLLFGAGAIYAWDRAKKSKHRVGRYHRHAYSRYSRHHRSVRHRR